MVVVVAEKMMNLLGLGSLKKSPSSPGGKGESPSSSPIRKLTFFGGNNGGSSKEKEKDPTGKVANVTPEKKGSTKSEATATTSSRKLKVQKTTSSGKQDDGGKVKATATSSIDPSSFGANGTAAAVVAGVIAGEDPQKKELEELQERAAEVANEVKLCCSHLINTLAIKIIINSHFMPVTIMRATTIFASDW